MQPETVSPSPATPPTGNKAKLSKKLLFIVIGAAVAVIVIVAALILLKPGGPSGHNHVARPGVTIAGKPYVYACSMFTRDDVASAFGIANKDKAFIATTDTFSTNGKPVDVLGLTEKESYGSSCTYNFDVADLTPEAREKAKKVDIYAVQYKDEVTAKNTYEEYKAGVSAKPLPSFKTGYAYAEQDEDAGKKFISASVLRGNIEIIVTTSADFGLNEDQQIAKIDSLMKRAFSRIDDGTAKVMPDFNGIASIEGQPASDVCTNLDIASVGTALGGVAFRPTDVYGAQNLTELTDSSYKLKSLESVCSYRFRTSQDGQDAANTSLAYDNRYGHLLTVSKRVYASEKDAQQTMKDTRENLQTPTSSGDSRGEYAEVNIAEAGARVINKSDDTSTYSYYLLDKNNFYRISVTSNTKPQKSFTSKGVDVTDDFIKTVFEQARR